MHVLALVLGGSADEKMLRVVRDRERWFQIVMGQKFEFDEASSEDLSNRILLPEELAEELCHALQAFFAPRLSERLLEAIELRAAAERAAP
jgi:hypothetical protein